MGECSYNEKPGGLSHAFCWQHLYDDLIDSQKVIANWFKDKHCEGKVGSAPTAEELAVFLESHDLFIYSGHGCGRQYIPRDRIQELINCAASLLMGCSSGSFKLNGSYAAQGTPLSYLQGGSPFIVATLWEVTDKEISKFAKAMLDAWSRERSYTLVDGNAVFVFAICTMFKECMAINGLMQV